MITPHEKMSLAKYTSLHVGGEARYFIPVHNDDEVRQALEFSQAQQLPFFILGKGSNTLFSDHGFPGVVIYMADRSIKVEGTKISAASGVFMRQLVNAALKHTLRGLEELAGIPGTVGGAVRGNAGTWQTEIKDVMTEVEVLKPVKDTWQLTFLKAQECEFGYRDSIFKHHPDWIIVRAHFALHTGDPEAGKKLVQQDLEQRHQKQPYDAPSAGSMFKNPDKARQIFSGALIEAAGLKGQKIGGAEISSKHANFIVNRGQATSADVLALVRRAQAAVKEKSGISLEPEIVIVE